MERSWREFDDESAGLIVQGLAVVSQVLGLATALALTGLAGRIPDAAVSYACAILTWPLVGIGAAHAAELVLARLVERRLLSIAAYRALAWVSTLLLATGLAFAAPIVVIGAWGEQAYLVAGLGTTGIAGLVVAARAVNRLRRPLRESAAPQQPSGASVGAAAAHAPFARQNARLDAPLAAAER